MVNNLKSIFKFSTGNPYTFSNVLCHLCNFKKRIHYVSNKVGKYYLLILYSFGIFYPVASGLLQLLHSCNFPIGHCVSNFWCRVQSISCFTISHYNLGSILSVFQQYFEFCCGMWYLKTLLYFSKLSCHFKSVVRRIIIWRSQSELCCCKSVLHS